MVRDRLHSASVIMPHRRISRNTPIPPIVLFLALILGPLLTGPFSGSSSSLEARSELSEPTAEEYEEEQHVQLDQKLRELRSLILGYSFKCYGSASKLVGPDILRKGCTIPSRFSGDGDSTLWNGLLCFTGANPWACEAVKKSQSDDGRIWRSPRRMLTENDGNDYPQASFSRDMARGVLLYILETEDRDLAQRWSDYMSGIGALCPDHTDWSCDIRSTSYRRINHVLATAGLDGISFAYTVFPCLWPTYPVTAAFHETVMESRVEKNESFHLHLAAIDLMMDPHLKKPLYDDMSRQEMAAVLFRRKPYNLFYQYLAQGPTIQLKKRILEFAPRTRPPFLSQWVWEREIPPRDLDKFARSAGAPSEVEQEKAFKEFVRLESMGWDFVFLIDMVLDKRP